MTDRMAAMGEIELVKRLRLIESGNWAGLGRDWMQKYAGEAADMIESLSAPVEDEEKVCREIARVAHGKWLYSEPGHTDVEETIVTALLEYARRLRPPVGVTVGEPALTGVEVTDEMVERAAYAMARRNFKSWWPSPETIANADKSNRADGDILRGFVASNEKQLAERVNKLRPDMRAAITAALQANGVSGSPSSPIQTRELEEAEAIGCGGLK